VGWTNHDDGHNDSNHTHQSEHEENVLACLSILLGSFELGFRLCTLNTAVCLFRVLGREDGLDELLNLEK
jgi:hypothetical protein